MKLKTIWKWWDHLRVGLCRQLAANGIEVRPLPYDDLSENEQEIVYDYWMSRQLESKARTKKENGREPGSANRITQVR